MRPHTRTILAIVATLLVGAGTVTVVQPSAFPDVVWMHLDQDDAGERTATPWAATVAPEGVLAFVPDSVTVTQAEYEYPGVLKEFTVVESGPLRRAFNWFGISPRIAAYRRATAYIPGGDQPWLRYTRIESQ